MPCGTLTDIKPAAKAEALALGLDNNEAGIVVQSIKITSKVDKKEALGSCGEVIAVNYYNKNTEIEIQGLGKASCAIATVLTLANLADLAITPESSSAIIVDEVSLEYANQDFIKSTIKAVSFEGLTSAA